VSSLLIGLALALHLARRKTAEFALASLELGGEVDEGAL
jgi:hypothetical protein